MGARESKLLRNLGKRQATIMKEMRSIAQSAEKAKGTVASNAPPVEYMDENMRERLRRFQVLTPHSRASITSSMALSSKKG